MFNVVISILYVYFISVDSTNCVIPFCKQQMLLFQNGNLNYIFTLTQLLSGVSINP